MLARDGSERVHEYISTRVHKYTRAQVHEYKSGASGGGSLPPVVMPGRGPLASIFCLERRSSHRLPLGRGRPGEVAGGKTPPFHSQETALQGYFHSPTGPLYSPSSLRISSASRKLSFTPLLPKLTRQ